MRPRSAPATGLALAAAAVFVLVAPRAAEALPVHYALQAAQSRVGFETDFGPGRVTGSMPVSRAELTLDPDRVANCRVAVTLDVTGARTDLPFAAAVMKGPSVLDVQSFPAITFVSSGVRAGAGGAPTDGVVAGSALVGGALSGGMPIGGALIDGALIDGALTIRGVTRPVTLAAQVRRDAGRAAGDLSHLAVLLTGTISRSAFGASGWPGTIGDAVRLTILARIARTGG